MLNVKGKSDNVWSVDNELAAKDKGRGGSPRRRDKRRVVRRKRSDDGGGKSVLVSGAMLMEVETVLQTQVFSNIYCLFVCLIVFYFWGIEFGFFLFGC